MWPLSQALAAARGWQELSLACARLSWSSAQVIQARTAALAAGTLAPAEAMRMVWEKPAAFALGMEKAMVAASRSPDFAAAALAGIAPLNVRASANARRLNRRKSS